MLRKNLKLLSLMMCFILTFTSVDITALAINDIQIDDILINDIQIDDILINDILINDILINDIPMTAETESGDSENSDSEDSNSKDSVSENSDSKDSDSVDYIPEESNSENANSEDLDDENSNIEDSVNEKSDLIVFESQEISEEPLFSTIPTNEMLETDVTTAGSGNTMLAVKGSFYANVQDAINRINEIRYEACTSGDVPDPRNSSRMLTPEDYVPIQWSQALESIARIRAAEASVSCSLNGPAHERLTSKNIYLYQGGIKSSGEILAWNSSTNMIIGINQWYEEKEDWQTMKTYNGSTGHYWSLINPNYVYYGLAKFNSPDVKYGGCLAGEFSANVGTMGQTPLPTYENIYQKIEVDDDYIAGWFMPSKSSMLEDDTQKLVVQVRLTGSSSSSQVYSLDEITFKSSNTAIATVDNDGNILAKKAGTVTITVYANGTQVRSLDITINCNHNYAYSEADVNGKISGICTKCGDETTATAPSYFYLYWKNSASSGSYISAPPFINPLGTDLVCNITNVNGDSSFRDIIIESSNEAVIASPDEPVKPGINNLPIKSCGVTELTIYPKYNPSLKKTIIVRAGGERSVDISCVDVTLSQDSYIYTGYAQKPSVVVSVDGITLTSGTDYTISYENNTNAGIANVIITGNGIFSGSTAKPFTIEQPEIVDSDVKINAISYPYDGNAKTPSTTVRCNGKLLIKGTDYTLSYENNINAGTSTVIVTGIGNYKGVAHGTFEITPYDISFATVTLSYPNGTSSKPVPKVVLNSNTLIEGTDYKVSYVSEEDYLCVTGINNYSGEVRRYYEKPAIEFLGNSGSIDGELNFKFYFLLNSRVTSSSNAYMTFTSGGKELANIKVKSLAKTNFSDGNECYTYKCSLAPSLVNQDIEVKLYIDGKQEGEIYTANMVTYLKEIAGIETDSDSLEYSDADKEMALMVLWYCNYVQKYVETQGTAVVGGSNYIGKVLDADNNPIADINILTLCSNLSRNSVFSLTDNSDIFDFEGSSLDLKDGIDMMLYFNVNENVQEYRSLLSNATYSINGNTPVNVNTGMVHDAKNGLYYIRIEGISIKNIDNIYTVEISYEKDGEAKIITVQYNPMRYMYKSVLSNYGSNENMELYNVILSLYQVYMTANK